MILGKSFAYLSAELGSCCMLQATLLLLRGPRLGQIKMRSILFCGVALRVGLLAFFFATLIMSGFAVSSGKF